MIETSTTLINPLGQFLKKERASKGWSQEHFAEISGVSTRTLQRIEGGEKANVETLRAVAAALNMEVTALLPLNALVSEDDFAQIQAQVQEMVQKEQAQLEKELNILPRMRNGKELLDVVASVQVLNTDHPPPASQEEAAAVGELLSMVKDYGDIHKDLEPQQNMEIILETTRCIEAVESLGLIIFAGKLRGHIVFPPTSRDDRPLRMRQAGVFICRASDIKTFTNPEGREAFGFRIPYGPVNL